MIGDRPGRGPAAAPPAQRRRTGPPPRPETVGEFRGTRIRDRDAGSPAPICVVPPMSQRRAGRHRPSEMSASLDLVHERSSGTRPWCRRLDPREPERPARRQAVGRSRRTIRIVARLGMGAELFVVGAAFLLAGLFGRVGRGIGLPYDPVLHRRRHRLRAAHAGPGAPRASGRDLTCLRFSGSSCCSSNSESSSRSMACTQGPNGFAHFGLDPRLGKPRCHPTGRTAASWARRPGRRVLDRRAKRHYGNIPTSARDDRDASGGWRRPTPRRPGGPYPFLAARSGGRPACRRGGTAVSRRLYKW
jgi:hypothetical protein